MNVTVNVLEVASEMAERELILQLRGDLLKDEDTIASMLYEWDKEKECSHYKEEYQDMFNEYYDKWYSFLLLLDREANNQRKI